MATDLDHDGIQKVNMHAFPESENKLISKLAISLLSEKTTPQTISLVAEADGMIVGHTAFSPVRADTDKNFLGYILAPLAIDPNFQKRLIGSTLVKTGIEMLSTLKVNILFVYGDPEYYSRFGFSTKEACHYTPTYKLQYPFGWQAVMLGEYDTPTSPLSLTCVDSLCHPELW
ncbi:MAG: N-acetyltransferase [Candidatus Thiodiazotropha sp. L084R]